MLIAFFLISTSYLAGYDQLRRFRHRRDPRNFRLPRRLTNAQLARFGARQILFAAVLAASWFAGGWDARSVGLHHDSVLYAILAGEVGFLALVLIHLAGVFALRKLPAMRVAAARGNMRIWPRGRVPQAFAVLFIMVMNPFVEELVMRGILIHQWGLALGSPVLPIAVGFVLNALLHWYQGWRMQFWHALFFLLAVGLLYSPFGLAAAITAHALGDVLPFIGMRRNLLRGRDAMRAARKSHDRHDPHPAGDH